MQENDENKKGMNKKQNLLYFKWKGKALDPDNAEAVTIRLITAIDSTTKIIWKTELTLVEEKMKKSCNRPGNTQRRLLKY